MIFAKPLQALCLVFECGLRPGPAVDLCFKRGVTLQDGLRICQHGGNVGSPDLREQWRERFFEVTPDGEIVWEFWDPRQGEVLMPDGSTSHPVYQESAYAVFRATKILPDHPGLGGRRLVPLDPQPPTSR